jgi:hypothetical protein
MKYSMVVSALAATVSAVPDVVGRADKKIRQYGYPTTKPIVNAVRPSMTCWFEPVTNANHEIDTAES